jgi:glucan phosphoethanolaminetransferase (alkaline phosphatase superfamily)
VRARKKFAVSLVIGFPAIAIVFLAGALFKAHSLNHFFVWLGAIGFAVGLVLWLLPQIAKPFYLVWYFLACCMGIVIGNLLFALFFYFVFTPLGLLLRLRKHRPIEKGFDKSRKSYWRDAEKTPDAERYFRQF